VYTLCQTLRACACVCVCYLYRISKNYLSVVSSFCFCVVFVLLLLHLSVRFISLRLIPHPTVGITNLGMHEMNVCMYVCMYACMYVRTYVRGLFEKFVNWRQCTAVMQRRR
jgi:hypothetical protein